MIEHSSKRGFENGTPIHTLNCLFDQLGLPSNDDDIAGLIERHKPVGDEIYIHQMSFFHKSQRAFL